MALKTDYKDFVAANGRKYKIADNGDGTSSIEDVTAYTQEGDSFGAADLNAMARAINAALPATGTAADSAKWGGYRIQVVDALPASPSTSTIYFVRKG